MKDTLFDHHQVPAPFEFNAEVAKVFDDMVSRSVPFYHHINQVVLDLLDTYFQEGSSIYDLGCSTGTTLLNMAKHLDRQKKKYQLVGVDASVAMIEKCQQKLSAESIDCDLIHSDIQDVILNSSSFVVMNYTLQFIEPELRAPLIKRVYESLENGGVFVLSEKIYSPDSEIHQLTTDLYYDFKRRNGYSDLEISQKREALENVLVPYSAEEQIALLKDSGFEHCEMLFRWYNFACFVGIKKQCH